MVEGPTVVAMVDRLQHAGLVRREIARYALQTGADLLIIGHISHFSLGHWLQGSVARALMRGLPCSILVAKKR
ncbi:MAG: universal stress protein [Gammaproteobacteria bacterium]|jgi:nucleotide-binding universal stress UspA family protein|nr:universal stress protein [Gammaproteobacteria bacterium]